MGKLDIEMSISNLIIVSSHIYFFAILENVTFRAFWWSPKDVPRPYILKSLRRKKKLKFN